MESLNKKTTVSGNGFETVGKDRLEKIKKKLKNKKEKLIRLLKREMKKDIKEIVQNFLMELTQDTYIWPYNGATYKYIEEELEDRFADYIRNEYILGVLEDELVQETESVEDILSEKEWDEIQEFVGKLVDEVMRDDDLYLELTSALKKLFEKKLIEKAKEIIEVDLRNYESIGIVGGLSSLTHKYTPVYKVYSLKPLNGMEDLQNALEELGVEPYLWGIDPTIYGEWGNFWWLVLNKDNYQRLIKKNLDIAILCCVNAHTYNEAFIYPQEDEE